MTPAYVAAYGKDGLKGKVERALELLEKPCRVCPRYCKVNRKNDERGPCRTGRYAVVSSYFAHWGEEDCLRGWRGSGTIFFAHCNLRCQFCQNYETSQLGVGRAVSPEGLADIMLELAGAGCHNINFVTPEHVVPQIVEALPSAIGRGLRLPLVYNTSGYDSRESLEILDGLIDIYMPDFKYWDQEAARHYSKVAGYPEAARRSIKEMHRQVGDLKVDARGVATRGLLVRHLVLPGGVAGTREVMRFLVREVSPDTYVNLMDQYRPAWKAHRYPEINRRLARAEYEEARAAALKEGIRRLDR